MSYYQIALCNLTGGGGVSLKYNFITRYVVKNGKSNTTKKWTLVGIICLFIAMILELLINQIFGFVFIVPLIYLISLYSHSSGSEVIQEVEIEMTFFGNNFSILFKDTVKRKDEVLSELYVINYSDVKQLTFNNNMICFQADAEFCLISKENDMEKKKFEEHKLFNIFVPDHVYELVTKALTEKTTHE